MATEELGHRPAVTVLSTRGREEQGVASLAQWAAKGAHLLELDLLVEPGDLIVLDAPLSWTTAAVCLAAWWAGATIELPGDDDGARAAEAEVAVVHETRKRPGAADVLWLGDAIDGAPLTDVAGEAWVHAVQSFPDQPPAPRATADAVALAHGDRRWTQRQLLDHARELVADRGTLGLVPDDVAAADAAAAVALRPLLVGRPTVVLHDVERDAAAGEKVRSWLPTVSADGV